MDTPDNATWQKILYTAEELFTKRGYAAVRLREIADAVDMKHASLYYYAPGGKKQLFMEVMKNSFDRHRQGLTEGITAAGDDFRAQLYAVADWFVQHPPVQFTRMHEADMTEFSPEQAAELMQHAYDAVRIPIADALSLAHQKDDLQIADINLAAMAFVSLISSVHDIPAPYISERQKLSHELVDMLLEGLLPR
jgi:AcrR family transcriptional regulator